MKHYIQAVIFDMDGLLLDTEPLWGESMMSIAEKHGVPITRDLFKATTGLRIFEVTDYWREHFPWKSNISAHDMAEEILDDIIALSKNKARVMPGVWALLHRLQGHGIKVGVATSSPYRMLHALLDHFQLTGHFHAIVSADETGIGKPHPSVFLHCAEQLNTEATKCLVLEDSVNGMIAGLAARMRTIVVPDDTHRAKPAFAAAYVKLKSLEEWNDAFLL